MSKRYKELRELVKKSLDLSKLESIFSYRDVEILKMRFGIGENSEHTLEQIAKRFNISTERVRQIEAKAIRKLMPNYPEFPDSSQ